MFLTKVIDRNKTYTQCPKYDFLVSLIVFKVTEQELICYTYIPELYIQQSKGLCAHTKITEQSTITFETHARIKRVFLS
jgi:hypothetical protein